MNMNMNMMMMGVAPVSTGSMTLVLDPFKGFSSELCDTQIQEALPQGMEEFKRLIDDLNVCYADHTKNMRRLWKTAFMSFLILPLGPLLYSIAKMDSKLRKGTDKARAKIEEINAEFARRGVSITLSVVTFRLHTAENKYNTAALTITRTDLADKLKQQLQQTQQQAQAQAGFAQAGFAQAQSSSVPTFTTGANLQGSVFQSNNAATGSIFANSQMNVQ